MRVLIYGDSNSWGLLDDGQGLRYDGRWPKIMAEHLTKRHDRPVEIIEECLPGRTTAYPDPQEGPEYNGLPFLKPALLSHAPLDLVLVMLGTNDGKIRFGARADEIADNLITLAKIIRRAPVGQGKWRDSPAPKVLVISPAKLGTRTQDKMWVRFDEWQEGYDKLAALPALLAQKITAVSDEGVFFADANQAVTPSHRDPIHWPASSHHDMGAYIADCITQFGLMRSH